MRLGDKKNKTEEHGFFEINSYGISQALINLNTGAFGAYVVFFLETELHLDIILLMIIFVIYSIWDAINEPYIGNLSDRTNKFTKKWGRRLPWIIIGIFLWPIFYILIFLTPNIGSTPILGLTYMYVLIILILYDLFYTLWSVNSEALLPYKFRDLQERRKVSGIRGFWGIIGLTLGFIIPPLIIDSDVVETFILQAVILGVITIIGGILMIPGHIEEQEIIENYLDFKTNRKINKSFFFKNLISALKKKNFVIMIILHFTYTILTALLILSLNFFIKFNLKLEEEALIIGILGYIIFSIISIPIWIKIAKKINNNKNMMTIGAISMSLATFPLFFANDIIVLFIIGCFIGLTGGIFSVMQDAINADVIDESIVIDEERKEGIYLGIKMFIGRLANATQYLIFFLVQFFTGFISDVDDQTPLALFGIRLHMSIIPALILLIGALIFWFFYDLTPKKTEEIHLKIKKLNI